MRPGQNEPAPSLYVSRPLLGLQAKQEGLEVVAASGAKLRVDGAEVSRATVAPGSVISVAGELILVCVRRPPVLPALRSFPVSRVPPFGEPDAFGLAGESPETWRVRDTIAVAARAPVHVLIVGSSGTGKGIAARMLLALSPRTGGPVVVCSDGQLADDLAARTAEGTLVVDPGEALGPEMQARLLHLARTQRPESLAAAAQSLMKTQVVVLARGLAAAFRDELRSRFMTVTLPSFDTRREDLPIIARARVLALASTMPQLATPFVTTSPSGMRAVRLDGDLIEMLLLRRWTAGGFEMDRVLVQSMHESSGDTLTVPAALSLAGANAVPPSNVAQTAPSTTLADRLGLPLPLTWGEVRIRPVDGLTVLLTVRTRSSRCTHVELDLASAKSRGPTKAWELLLATCEGRGTFDWRRFGNTRDTARKQVERLSEALTAAFKLEDPPFAPFDPRRGWVAKFLAVPER
jgi:two-component system nitrogen regulation response regulator GlnG/two-component system response regulator HydG